MQETFDSETAQRMHQQCFDLWFNPELKRRLDSGVLQPDFSLFAAQALFPEVGSPIVRFNNEARFRGVLKATRNIRSGERLLVSDLSTVDNIELENSELNCGHITLLFTDTNRITAFNLLRGRDRAANLVDQAQQFLHTGAMAAANNYGVVAIENLHTAFEKVSLAYLIVHAQQAAHGKTHSVIRSGINKWARLSNVDQRFVSAFNKVASIRDKVRYLDRPSNDLVSPDLCDILSAEISRIRRYWRWRDGDPILENLSHKQIVRVTAEIAGSLLPPQSG